MKMEVVFPRVVVTNHKEFMYGDVCRRHKFLKVEMPEEYLPYHDAQIGELELMRDAFEENYIDSIKQRFIANFFDKHPRHNFIEKLEENAVLYYNLFSLCDAYVKNIQRTSESKKSKKQRYRRNKKKNDQKKKEELNEKKTEGLHPFYEDEKYFQQNCTTS
jgi:hypothetical protein